MRDHPDFRPRLWPPNWPDITDPAVLDALRAVPRHRFVTAALQGDAYADIPLPIGHGQTISQPYIVALMTQALALTPTSRVLEIGCGSGYQAAILAHLTRHVWSVETVPELARKAQTRLAGLGYAVAIKVGDGNLGWEEHAPFDRIIVTAAPVETPPRLVQQLAEDGRLVIPVGPEGGDQTLWLIQKRRGGGLQGRRLAPVRFVPLVTTATLTENDPELSAIRRQLRDIM